jgi:hypothetical protein
MPKRYRMNAADCLSAAEECELPFRGLTLAIAESWLSLAAAGHRRTSGDLEQSQLPHVDGIKPAVFYPLDLHWPLFAASARGQVRGGSTRA